MPATFLDEFKTAITMLESSMHDREQNYNRRLSATEGLDAQEKQGRLVLGVLDRLLQPALVGNDPLKRGWEGARQIRRRPGPTVAAPDAAATAGAGASSATTAPTTSTTSTTPPVAAA